MSPPPTDSVAHSQSELPLAKVDLARPGAEQTYHLLGITVPGDFDCIDSLCKMVVSLAQLGKLLIPLSLEASTRAVLPASRRRESSVRESDHLTSPVMLCGCEISRKLEVAKMLLVHSAKKLVRTKVTILDPRQPHIEGFLISTLEIDIARST